MTENPYIKQAEGFSAVSDEGPGGNFLDFHEQHRENIGTILLGLKKDYQPTDGFTLQAGMMPPGSYWIN